MNKSGADRWLIGIVTGVILLILIALVTVLNREEPTYVDDVAPDGVVHNYLLALQQEAYARAYSYLSPTLPNYPVNAEAFYDHVRDQQIDFRNGGRRATAVRDVDYFGDNRATVRVEETTFYSGGLFGGDQSTSSFHVELARIEGDWKLIDGDSYWYWHPCWSSAEIECPLPLGDQP